MGLSTRLTAAMISLVVLTAGIIGVVSYRSIEAIILPRSLERLDRQAELLAAELAGWARPAPGDVLSLRGSVSVEGMVAAEVAGGTDPIFDVSYEQWRRRTELRFAADLAVKPNYLRYGLVGTARGGREIVRVERTAPGGGVRILPDGELTAPRNRDFFLKTLSLRDGTFHVSAVESRRLDPAVPVTVPTLDVATPIYDASGKVYGILYASVDLRPALVSLQTATRQADRVFAVGERGEILAGPVRSDPAAELDRPGMLSDEFPGLTLPTGEADPPPRVIASRSGESFGVGIAAARLADGPRVGVVVASPFAELISSTAAVRESTLIAGLLAGLAAAALAVLLSRSMTRPLVQITRAVEAFGRGDAPAIPINAGGEIGQLARAFARMAELVNDKTAVARRSGELLDKTLASMSDGVLVLDPTGRTLFANPACKVMFGEEFEIGSQEWQKYHYRFRPDGVTPYPPEETPVGRGVRGESFDNLELICRRVVEGDAIRIVASGRVIRSEKGRYDGAVIVYRDVTELYEKTAAIRRNADIFASIMSSMTDGVLLVDEHAHVVFANDAARALMGAHADTGLDDWTKTYEVLTDDGASVVPTSQWPIVRAVCGENVDNFAFVLRRLNSNRVVRLVVTARPLEQGLGGPTGAVIVMRDVTKLDEVERQLRQSQKMDAIGQLTGGVAHDFNNLLTVITGTIEILAEGVADRPKLLAITKLIDEAATRGSALTQQLLAFARRQALQPQRIDVNNMVLETARLLRPTLGEQIDIRVLLGAEVCPANIDPSQLSTALLNLAVNARDAMPAGGRLTVETANVVLDEAYARDNPEAAPGTYVSIAVSDTGTGIPQAIRDKVFEPFFTTKDTGKGTGLGLSMVYGFVKQSDGHIKILSEEGVGTTIKLYLPYSDEPAVPAATPSEQARGGGETILVVEDDDMVRTYVVAQLKSLGYDTLAAENGAAALARVDAGENFDLLFTDIIMPGGMNGRELAEEVVKRRPGMKVLYTSGYAENAIVHHGRLDAGLVVLKKPYRKAELAAKIRDILDAAG